MYKRYLIIFISILIVLITICIIYFLKYNSNNKISIVFSKGEKLVSKKVFSLEDYDIYYYGIEKVKIQGKDLIKILEEDNSIMEKIIQQAEIDAENGYCIREAYLDGGSKIYIYNNYAIIKCHRDYDFPSKDNINKDIYIGPMEMRLSDVI